jgi:hypothetical protein
MNVARMMKQPTAFLPLVLSLAALGTVAVTVARFGVVREPDEGTAAHIWQLLMAAQAPIILLFAIRWLPRAPKPALCVLALQAGAALAAVAPIVFLGL